jgi:hypothetical protein
MKDYIFLSVYIFFSFNGFGQEYLPASSYINYPMAQIAFKDNKIFFWEAGTLNRDGTLKEAEKNLNGTYYLETTNNIKFLNIKWENGQTEKYLILYNNNLCYLYKDEGYMFFRGFKITNAAPGEFCFNVNYRNVQIESSSYLTERNVEYSTMNLNEKIGICWAEGVPGNGIGETLSIKMAGANTLHISIGFISLNKPYLFNENARPSKVELSVQDKYSIIANLDDTPNFQTIKLPEKLEKDETLKIKILDVYKGIKYEDTCINMILIDEAKY